MLVYLEISHNNCTVTHDAGHYDDKSLKVKVIKPHKAQAQNAQ